MSKRLQVQRFYANRTLSTRGLHIEAVPVPRKTTTNNNTARSLALLSQHTSFPSSVQLPNSFSSIPTQPHSARSSPKSKKKCSKFRLSVGAYGIPKRPSPIPNDGLLSVSVGEDAYFIREDAIGVADGVGGWRQGSTSTSPSPSALFARRLMHHCSAEISSGSWAETAYHPPPPPSIDEMEEDLSEQLEDLADGIDILMILERAYQKTLADHVEPPLPPTPVPISQSWIPSLPFFAAPTPPPKPLLSGSSTVLLAVLDSPSSPTTSEPLPSPSPSRPLLKIANLGDCMGMLVRGDDVIWRSEEMWWSFNHPLQLGPSQTLNPTTPMTSARTYTLPVEPDDILILASDGLSDNLWDEDVLEEVRRWRRGGWISSDAESSLEELGIDSASSTTQEKAPIGLLWKHSLASLLSESLASRARRVSTTPNRAPHYSHSPSPLPFDQWAPSETDAEIPFARRAREAGKSAFLGGKRDDISVIVAVISKVEGADS